MSNTKTDIDTYLKRLKKAVNKTKQKMAHTAIHELISASPVRTGSYINSHKVGINTLVTGHEKVYTIWQPAMLPAMQKALKAYKSKRMMGEVLSADFDDTIIISNLIPYADRVEYIGWQKTSAKHPFGKAKLALKAGKYLLKSFTNAPIK